MGQNDNLLNIGNLKEPDISVDSLKDKLKRNIDSDFKNNPSTTTMLSTENKGIIEYPLILIKNVKTANMAKLLKESLLKVKNGMMINFYINVPEGGGVKTVFWAKNKIDIDFVNTLQNMLIDYVYFEEKGLKTELRKEDLIDYESFKDVILPENTVERTYGEEFIEKRIDDEILSKYNFVFQKNDEKVSEDIIPCDEENEKEILDINLPVSDVVTTDTVLSEGVSEVKDDENKVSIKSLDWEGGLDNK